MLNRWRTYGVSSLLAGLLLGLGGCVDVFKADVTSAPPSYLVVDGLVNLRGVTTVRLSHTRSLSTTVAPVEAKASVSIQDEAGARYALTEQSPGTYASAALTLDASHRYQLRLRTAAGREYASDLVAGKLSPPIDKLSWALETNGVQLYLDAHDASNATRYYRWTFQETWEFHPPYHSEYEYVNGAMRYRTENIYQCWRTESSTAIVLGSTARLSQDVVANAPLLLLPANSPRLGVKYSILVQQYAQSAEEAAYWERLKKNTESLGTLFDPLPTQLGGNVHCLSDASEQVLGYVGASSMTERRLFIDPKEFPAGTSFLSGYDNCDEPDSIPGPFYAPYFVSPYIPLYPLYDTGGKIIGYFRAVAGCADCRVRGTNVKPSFWP